MKRDWAKCDGWSIVPHRTIWHSHDDECPLCEILEVMNTGHRCADSCEDGKRCERDPRRIAAEDDR